MSTWPAGWRVDCLDEVSSTQDAAWARAERGERRIAVLARRQTAGRGRAGRNWTHAPGNLALSAVAPATEFPLSLIAGIAACDAVRDASGLVPMLKWPNDLFHGGAKLGGLLVERGPFEEGWAVIGLGLNLAAAPAIPGRRTVSLAELGAAAAPESIAALFLARLDDWLARDGAVLREAWLARAAHPPGTMLRVEEAGIVRQGAFAGLDARGALLLEGEAAPVLAGDVEMAV